MLKDIKPYNPVMFHLMILLVIWCTCFITVGPVLYALAIVMQILFLILVAIFKRSLQHLLIALMILLIGAATCATTF